MNYSFTEYFNQAFIKNTKMTLDEDKIAYILMVCNNYIPHTKIDDKGRDSAYFNCHIDDVPITIVCDSKRKKIITAVIEKRNRSLDDMTKKIDKC